MKVSYEFFKSTWWLQDYYAVRLEYFKRFSADNFGLSDAKGNTSGTLNRGGRTDLPFLRTILPVCQNSFEQSFSEMTHSFVLFLNIIKFDSFKNPFATITSMSELFT